MASEMTGETLAEFKRRHKASLGLACDRSVSGKIRSLALSAHLDISTVIEQAATIRDQQAQLTTLRTQCQVAEAERDYARRLLSADAQEVMRLRQQWIDDERDLTALAEENERLQSLLYRATEDAGRQRD